MKSSIRFDLDGQNNAVITARIVQSDDLRDKAAKINFDRLSYDSTLAFVSCVHSSVGNGVDTGIGIVNFQDPYNEWQIKTVSYFKEDCTFLSKYMSDVQLNNMLEATTAEIKRRKAGGKVARYTGEAQELISGE